MHWTLESVNLIRRNVTPTVETASLNEQHYPFNPLYANFYPFKA